MALLCAVAANSVVYGVITVLRYYAYNAAILDLGVASQLLYSTMHGGVSWPLFVGRQLSLNRPIYLILGPLYDLFPFQPLLVVSQAFWISVGAIPLFGISMKYLHREWMALMISISYLLYYPLGGVMWFDFHFMALFPTLFLLSVYFYLSGHPRLSYGFILLAIATDYLVPLIAIFYSFYVWFSARRELGFNPLKNRLAMAILATGIVEFAIVTAYLGLSFLGNTITLPAIRQVSIPDKVYFLLRMMLPVLFVCLLAPEIMVMAIPYAGLALHNNYLPYVTTMFYQYPSLIAPIIFVSTAKGISRLMLIVSKYGKRVIFVCKQSVTAVLALNLVLMMFLTPAGQLLTGNAGMGYLIQLSGSGSTYNSLSDITVHKYDSYISKEISLVPYGSTILVPNNIPQVTQNYNWYISDGFNHSLRPQYILMDPYNAFSNWQTVSPTTPPDDSFINVTDFLLSTGSYGTLAEMDGITLYEHNYNGTPVYYIPIS